MACALVPQDFHKASLVRPGIVTVTWQKGGGVGDTRVLGLDLGQVTEHL